MKKIIEMKRILLLVFLVVIIVLPTISQESKGYLSRKKPIWIWNNIKDCDDNYFMTLPVDTLTKYIEKFGCNSVYLTTSRLNEDSDWNERTEDFISACHSKDISVYAILISGNQREEAFWYLPQFHDTALREISEKYISYQNNHFNTNQLFDGLLIDIEFALDTTGWDVASWNVRNQMVGQFQELTRKIRDSLTYHEGINNRSSFAAAIHWKTHLWYTENPNTFANGAVSSFVKSGLDYVIGMTITNRIVSSLSQLRDSRSVFDEDWFMNSSNMFKFNNLERYEPMLHVYKNNLPDTTYIGVSKSYNTIYKFYEKNYGSKSFSGFSLYGFNRMYKMYHGLSAYPCIDSKDNLIWESEGRESVTQTNVELQNKDGSYVLSSKAVSMRCLTLTNVLSGVNKEVNINSHYFIIPEMSSGIYILRITDNDDSVTVFKVMY